MINSLQNKKILIGVTGSIAVYKTTELVRQLRAAKAELRIVMTKGAQYFITPLTFESLSGNPVQTELFASEENAMEHIALARWADFIVVAPASANFIARLAHGMADDLLTTLCLATSAPIMLAPAMNQQMWQNSLTQQNIKTLQAHRILFCGPDVGSQACGEIGPGRMFEPFQIKEFLEQQLQPTTPLKDYRVLITAGPTQEPIDPVRYITNRSSGKMGYAMAAAARKLGAQVILISGPTHLTSPEGIEFVSVKTAKEMHAAVMAKVDHCDMFIATAAVADYHPVTTATQKIKKSQAEQITLSLQPNPDILAAVSAKPNPPMTIGFAAETEQLMANAETKLKNKRLDFIVANQVSDIQGFDADQNEVTVIAKNGDKKHFALMPKTQLAEQLMELFLQALPAKHESNK